MNKVVLKWRRSCHTSWGRCSCGVNKERKGPFQSSLESTRISQWSPSPEKDHVLWLKGPGQLLNLSWDDGQLLFQYSISFIAAWKGWEGPRFVFLVVHSVVGWDISLWTKLCIDGLTDLQTPSKIKTHYSKLFDNIAYSSEMHDFELWARNHSST